MLGLMTTMTPPATSTLEDAVAANLARECRVRNISFRQVAITLGHPPTWVARRALPRDNSNATPIYIRDLEPLAAAIGCTVSDLLGDLP